MFNSMFGTSEDRREPLLLFNSMFEISSRALAPVFDSSCPSEQIKNISKIFTNYGMAYYLFLLSGISSLPFIRFEIRFSFRKLFPDLILNNCPKAVRQCGVPTKLTIMLTSIILSSGL